MKNLLAALLIIIIGCGADTCPVFVMHPAQAQVVSANTGAVSAEGTEALPYNLVVVVIDFTVSFRLPSKAPGLKGRVFAFEALQLIQQFLHDAAKQTRRRNEGQDIYVIVALDAASETIWTGTREQVAELSADALKQKLAARDQFKWCTDIEAAFNEVVRLFHQYSNATEKYLLVFSDLINEPPRGEWTKCAPRSGEPPKGIDWGALKTARLGFYFAAKQLPYRPDVKWRTELERRGLQAEFLDTAQALTAAVKLNPPAPAIYKPTHEEVAIAQARVEGLAHTLLTAAACVFGLIVICIAALYGWVMWMRRRNTAGRRRS